MRTLSKVFLLVLVLLLAIPFASGSVAPVGVAHPNQSYEQVQGNDNLEVNANIPLSQEDVAFPVELFYILVAIGAGFAAFGFWLISRPDYIPSYTIMGVGCCVIGVFAILAYVAPITGTTTVTTQIIPFLNSGGGSPANATNTIYTTSVVDFVFSFWVSYAMCAGIVIGILQILSGLLSMFRTNREKSIEQSIDQDGMQDFRIRDRR